MVSKETLRAAKRIEHCLLIAFRFGFAADLLHVKCVAVAVAVAMDHGTASRRFPVMPVGGWISGFGQALLGCSVFVYCLLALLACLPACLLACLPARPQACLPTSQPALLPGRPHAEGVRRLRKRTAPKSVPRGGSGRSLRRVGPAVPGDISLTV